jgi:hypothetical protein
MEFPYLIPIRIALQERPDAIMVKIVEPEKSDLATLSDILINSLGLSGALAIFAVLLGLAVGGLVFWVRRRSA